MDWLFCLHSLLCDVFLLYLRNNSITYWSNQIATVLPFTLNGNIVVIFHKFADFWLQDDLGWYLALFVSMWCANWLDFCFSVPDLRYYICLIVVQRFLPGSTRVDLRHGFLHDHISVTYSHLP